ncbi:MAG: glycosyltransferase family 39 protein [Chloroflexi bacterium]|nr:glycosyltransferase family 39 protein [Chloroflexota bacterium]
MRDEGLYASVAQLILDGGVPYRDAFDNKPPLIFGIYSFSFILFGENVWAPRLLAAICLSLTTLLVYFQGRLVFSHNGGVIAALAFALSIGIADFQTNANTEYFLVLPMVGALVAFTLARRTDGAAWYVLAGVLSGLAVMTKQVAIFNFLVLLAVPLITSVCDGGWTAVASRRVVRPLIVMVSGFSVALAAVVAPFVITGAFGEFIDGVVLYPLSYSGGLSLVDRLGHALWSPIFLMTRAGPWVILTMFGVLFVARDEGSPDRRVLVLWLAACGLGVASTGRFYDHYFVQLLPAMALLVPAGVYFLKHAWGSRWARVTAMWLLPLSAAIPLFITAAIYLQPTAEARHVAKYASGEGALEINSAELAAYVSAVTSEDDYIYNLGFQSEIYFYADRRAPTRFLFDHPFAADEKYEIEALGDLQNQPPLYIIDSAAYESDSLKAENYYPVRIKEFVDKNYDYLGRLYYADLYRLREPSASDG